MPAKTPALKSPAARPPATPEAYLASLPDDRRQALTVIHEEIVKAAPKLPVKMRDMMGKPLITYGEFPYRFADGTDGTWFIIGLMSNKAHLSLYVSATSPAGYLVEQYREELGKVKTGRSCVNFKRLDDLNLPGVRKLLRKAAAFKGGTQSAGC